MFHSLLRCSVFAVTASLGVVSSKIDPPNDNQIARAVSIASDGRTVPVAPRDITSGSRSKSIVRSHSSWSSSSPRDVATRADVTPKAAAAAAFRTFSAVSILQNESTAKTTKSLNSVGTNGLFTKEESTFPWAVRLFVVGKVTETTARIMLELGPYDERAYFCKDDTGGTCRFLDCDGWRNAQCIDSVCACHPDQCAKDGKCENNEGRLSMPPTEDLLGEGESYVIVESQKGKKMVDHLPLSTVDKYRLALGRPVVLKFEGLEPASKYHAHINDKVKAAPWLRTGSSVAGFKTTASRGNASDLNVAAVSCNKARLISEGVIPELDNLWAPLAKNSIDGNVDIVLHLGDNVYVDDDRYLLLKGEVTAADFQITINRCLYCKWENLLKDLPKNTWMSYRGDMLESFRDIYRSVWSMEHEAKLLASTSNLFIPDDHEIRDDIGDQEADFDTTTVDYFISTVAWEVAQEYEVQPMVDVDFTAEGVPTEVQGDNFRCYTSHVIGQTGFIMLDERVSKSLGRVETDPEHELYLGSKQWNWLRGMLDEGGTMSDVQVLIVGSPVPIVYFTGALRHLVARVINDAEGMWQSVPTEQTNVLDLFLTWRRRKPGRVVRLVSGDVHHGAFTEIMKDNGTGTEHAMDQMITSSISNREINPIALNGLFRAFSFKNELTAGYSFKHHHFNAMRNYGLIEVKYKDDGPKVTGQLMISNGHGGVFGVSAARRASIVGPGAAVLLLLLPALRSGAA